MLFRSNGLASEGGSGSNFYYNGSGGTGNASWTVTPGGTYPVTCVVSNDSLSDTVTLHKIVGGSDGTTAKTVIVTPDAYFFVSASDGSVSPTSITISGSTQNTTADGAWSTSAGTLSDSENNHTKASTKVAASGFSDGMKVTYTLHGDDGSINDSVTLKLLDEGAGNVQAVVSNPAHTFQANSVGSIGAFDGGGTLISVYEGATALTFESTTADVSDGEFSASVDTTTGGITAGAFSGDGTITMTLAAPSTMTADTGSIRMTISGYTANSTTFSLPVTQSFAMSKAAAPAITTIISNETHTFQGTVAGVVSDFTNSGTTISVYEGTSPVLYDGTGTANSRFSSSASGSSIVQGTATDSGDYVTYGVASSQTANTPSSITYTIDGTDSEGSTFTQTKVQTFSISKAGTAGISAKTAELNTTSHVITYDANGENASPAN